MTRSSNVKSLAPSAEVAAAWSGRSSRPPPSPRSVLEFLDFLAKYPRHRLPGRAVLIGEAYYIQRDHRQALVEFQKVLEMPPDGKAAHALLKMGLCYVNLREPNGAQQAWRRVIREHPDSEAATKAKRFLRARRRIR